MESRWRSFWDNCLRNGYVRKMQKQPLGARAGLLRFTEDGASPRLGCGLMGEGGSATCPQCSPPLLLVCSWAQMARPGATLSSQSSSGGTLVPSLTPATHCPHLRLTHGGFPGHSLQQLLCAAMSWIKENSDQCQPSGPPWAVPSARRARVRSRLSTGFSPSPYSASDATKWLCLHTSPSSGCTDGTTLSELSLAVGTRASCLTSLSLGSLKCKMAIPPLTHPTRYLQGPS